MRRLMNWKRGTLNFIGIGAAVVALSACPSNPVEQITRRSSVGSGQAILVVGVADEHGVPRRWWGIALKGYSYSTEKLFL
jgi:hypothetical protein